MSQTENLNHKDSIEKMKEIALNQVCFLCTFPEPYQAASRPMTTQRISDEGDFIFFVKDTQDVVSQIKRKNTVDLLYHNNNSFLAIKGKARTYRNQEIINELYTPLANAWFDGKDDPGLLLLEVVPADAHYWDTAQGKIVTLYKLAQAAITGEDAEIGISGDLTV